MAEAIANKSGQELLVDSNRRGSTIPDEIQGHIRSPQKWPLVRFGTRDLLCVPQQFEVNGPDGQVLARREQVPLILAWALSIHKSQGQTLERVRVNMSRIFEKGQGAHYLTYIPSNIDPNVILAAYVALSRATSIDRLQVLNFDPATSD